MKTIKVANCENINHMIVGRVSQWLEVRIGAQDSMTEFVFIDDSEKEEAYYEFMELDEGDVFEDSSWTYVGTVFRYNLFHIYIFVRRLDVTFAPTDVKRPVKYQQMAMELN